MLFSLLRPETKRCARRLRLSNPTPRRPAPLNMALPRPTAAPILAAAGPSVADPDFRVGARWRRMLLRALARFDWSREGVRLWYVKHPELRWLPFPYPSVSSAEQWQLQVQSMVRSGCYPHRWVGRGTYSQAHLSSMTWFRNRVGLKFAFVEDPVLIGMLAARRPAGRTQQLKAAALREEAEAAAKEGDRLKVARSLLGPRGGLPTLKGDLIKLAALLHVEVSDKDTIKTLRDRMKPTADAICAQMPASSTDTFVEHSDLTASTTPLQPRQPSKTTSFGPMSPAPRPSTTTSFGTMSPGVKEEPNLPSQGLMMSASSASTLNAASLQANLMQAVDQRFQELGQRHEAMLSQVLHHIMNMQSVTATPLTGPDEEMRGNDDWELTSDPTQGTTVQPDHRRDQLGCLDDQGL